MSSISLQNDSNAIDNSLYTAADYNCKTACKDLYVSAVEQFGIGWRKGWTANSKIFEKLRLFILESYDNVCKKSNKASPTLFSTQCTIF